jgi:hypothetical protein
MLKCHASEDHACDQLGLLKGLALGRAATSARIAEYQENKDNKEQRQEVQTVHSMEAVKWKSRCTEDKETSTQETEVEPSALQECKYSSSSSSSNAYHC